MFDGFFKSEFRVNERVGRSVTHVRNGRLLGGNSGFAHIGTYVVNGDTITTEITSTRHNFQPEHQSLLGSDTSVINAVGHPDGKLFRFDGSSPQMPGATFQSVMTPLDESNLEPGGAVGEGGIRNGLYSLHLSALDGLAGGLTGVMLLHDGRILGGDASFYYVGSYSSKAGRWRGELSKQQHTFSTEAHPLFSGAEVGIGFSGTCDQENAVLEGVALAGKLSIRLRAVLKFMASE